jgi:hypothetical protein
MKYTINGKIDASLMKRILENLIFQQMTLSENVILRLLVRVINYQLN